MLQPIEDLVPDPITRLFAHYDAIDPESGAILWRTGGHTKGGLPKYVLIKPDVAPVPDTDWTQYRIGDWSNGNRRFIRAWSFAEALEIANAKLTKLAAYSRA